MRRVRGLTSQKSGTSSGDLEPAESARDERVVPTSRDYANQVSLLLVLQNSVSEWNAERVVRILPALRVSLNQRRFGLLSAGIQGQVVAVGQTLNFGNADTLASLKRSTIPRGST